MIVVSWMNLLLYLVDFKYFEVRKCLCGRLLAEMAKLFSSLYSCPLAMWLCRFSHQKMETIPLFLEFGLACDLL